MDEKRWLLTTRVGDIDKSIEEFPTRRAMEERIKSRLTNNPVRFLGTSVLADLQRRSLLEQFAAPNAVFDEVWRALVLAAKGHGVHLEYHHIVDTLRK